MRMRVVSEESVFVGERVRVADWSRSDGALAVSTDEGEICVLDRSTGNTRRLPVALGSALTTVRWSPTRHEIACSGHGPGLILVTPRNRCMHSLNSGGVGGVADVDWSPDGDS